MGGSHLPVAGVRGGRRKGWTLLPHAFRLKRGERRKKVAAFSLPQGLLLSRNRLPLRGEKGRGSREYSSLLFSGGEKKKGGEGR